MLNIIQKILKISVITAGVGAFCLIAVILLVSLLPTPVLNRLIVWEDTTTQGDYKGINIGDSRMTVLQKAGSTFPRKSLRYAHPIDQWGHGSMNTLTYSDSDYQNLKNRPVWEFYFGENFLKSIAFEFGNDTLRAVYRRTQLFELP